MEFSFLTLPSLHRDAHFRIPLRSAAAPLSLSPPGIERIATQLCSTLLRLLAVLLRLSLLWKVKLREAASFPAPMEGDGMDKLERMASVCEFDPITGNIPATKVEISVSCRYVKPQHF